MYRERERCICMCIYIYIYIYIYMLGVVTLGTPAPSVITNMPSNKLHLMVDCTVIMAISLWLFLMMTKN